VTVRIMSDKELARLDVLRDLNHQRLTATAAAEILGLGRRQVLRLLKAYRTSGISGLISKQRARPPPDCKHPGVTFLSSASRDISIWARHRDSLS
jgi:transposase